MKNDIEEILLSEKNFDELVKIKMEEEIKAEMINLEKEKLEIITEIKNVPEGNIFSKYTIFRVFNRINKTLSFVNGVQAEALIGMQKSVYEKLKNKEIDAFSTDDCYVKFEKTKIKK